MVEVVNETTTGDITTLDISLQKDEMSALIFVGMSENTYNDALLFQYSEELLPEFLSPKDFKQACLDNSVSEKDGFLYLQVGIQTALIRGINSLIEGGKVPTEDTGNECKGACTHDVLQT